MTEPRGSPLPGEAQTNTAALVPPELHADMSEHNGADTSEKYH